MASSCSNNMGEKRSTRLRRRSVSVPAMLGATALALFGLPVLLPAAAAVDLIRGRRRLPSARTYLFMLQYMVNDTVEIFAAPMLWVLAGFGTTLGSKRSIHRHEALQWLSLIHI